MKNALFTLSILFALFFLVALESRTEASVRFLAGTTNTKLDCGATPDLTTFTLAGSFTMQTITSSVINRITDSWPTQGYLAVNTQTTGGVASSSYRIQINRATTNCGSNSATGTLPALGSAAVAFGTYSETDGCRLYDYKYGDAIAPLTQLPNVTHSSNVTGTGATTQSASGAVGGRSGSTNASFPGDIHWVSVWNRILTPKEMMVAARRPWMVRSGQILLVFPGLEGRVSSTDYSGFKRGYSGICVASGTVANMSVQPTPGLFGAIRK